MIRRDLDGPVWWLGVPSRGRASAAAHQNDLYGGATWYVPADEVGVYEAAMDGRCTHPWDLVPVGERFPAARNLINRDAHRQGAVALQLDDDLRSCTVWDGVQAREVTPTAAMRRLAAAAERYGTLVGAAPTTNTRFARDGGMRRNLFCRAGMTAHPPAGWDAGVRYDMGLRLKEDYDVCLQYLRALGGWYRDDGVLLNFRQRSPVGGCSYRTPEREISAVQYLQAKWGDLVRPHPTRGPGECLLRVPRERAA